MKEPVCILLDGSLTGQKKLLAECKEMYDMNAWGNASRYYCGKKTLDNLHIPFDPLGRLIFYGSNDYHHLTYRLMRDIKEPVTLVVFDRHTECEKFLQGMIYCGSWVYDVLKLPNVDRVLIAGVDSDIGTIFLTDLLNPVFLRTIVDLKALDGRVAMFPYLPHNNRFLSKGDRERLDRIIRPPFTSVDSLSSDIIKEIRTDDVYISIDKDVLRSDDSLTEWGSGMMTLSELIRCVEMISAEKSVIGMDVCGDISTDTPHGLMRKLRHYANGRLGKGGSDAVGINERTNLELIGSFRSL